ESQNLRQFLVASRFSLLASRFSLLASRYLLLAPSFISTGEAGSRSRTGSPFASKRPNASVPVGHICTQAEQRTHSGSCIGRPLLAKLMMSMPWWHTGVQTLQEMHLDFSGKMRNFEKRV